MAHPSPGRLWGFRSWSRLSNVHSAHINRDQLGKIAWQHRSFSDGRRPGSILCCATLFALARCSTALPSSMSVTAQLGDRLHVVQVVSGLEVAHGGPSYSVPRL